MSKSSSGEGGGAIFVALMLVLWLVVTFFWWIVAGICVVALFFGIRALVRIDRRNRERHAAYCAAICARADQQHKWVLRGDDRGIYGPEGARLMRAIR